MPPPDETTTLCPHPTPPSGLLPTRWGHRWQVQPRGAARHRGGVTRGVTAVLASRVSGARLPGPSQAAWVTRMLSEAGPHLQPRPEPGAWAPGGVAGLQDGAPVLTLPVTPSLVLNLEGREEKSDVCQRPSWDGRGHRCLLPAPAGACGHRGAACAQRRGVPNAHPGPERCSLSPTQPLGSLHPVFWFPQNFSWPFSEPGPPRPADRFSKDVS